MCVYICEFLPSDCGLNLNTFLPGMCKHCCCKFVQYSVRIPVNTVSLEKCYCAESLRSESVCKHFLREDGVWGWGGRCGGPMLSSLIREKRNGDEHEGKNMGLFVLMMHHYHATLLHYREAEAEQCETVKR